VDKNRPQRAEGGAEGKRDARLDSCRIPHSFGLRYRAAESGVLERVLVYRLSRGATAMISGPLHLSGLRTVDRAKLDVWMERLRRTSAYRKIMARPLERSAGACRFFGKGDGAI
jgi:hypothetical protein